MPSLLAYQKQRHLISIRRAGVDDQSIQGFVLGVSDQLVALQYVYDFHLDGLLVLRRQDITEVRRTETDKFQQALLAQEGLGLEAPWGLPLALENWREIVLQLSGQFPLMILECELGPSPEFLIGRILKLTATQVEVQSFSGVARWAAKPERLKFANLTSLQVNTNYANTYQRHFERSAA